MEFGLVDYILVALIGIAIPIWGVIEHRRFMTDVASNNPNARWTAYRYGIAVEWILAIVVVAVWVIGGRGLSTLGFGLERSLGFWILGSLTVAVAIAAVVQMVAVVRSDEKLAKMRKQVGDLADMLPRDDRDTRWWAGLSISAGICEEVIYRGFMIGVLSAAIGTWPAVAVSSLAFGLGHSYQGAMGVFKTGVIGLVMGALFVLTGSLWALILLHAVVDITQGVMGRRAIEMTPARA